jgi:putative transposase
LYCVQISITEKRNSLEKTIAELVNGIIKQEYLNHYQAHSLAQAQRMLEQAMFLYNYKRQHLSFDMLSPKQAYQKTGQLKRRSKYTFGGIFINSFNTIK